MSDAERERLGRIVREAWVQYCKETGDSKTSHVTPWEDISEWDKEADRRIGEAVYAAASADTERLVRATVEATIDRVAFLQSSGTTYWTSELATVLRNNTDIDAIVARVMQSKEQKAVDSD